MTAMTRILLVNAVISASFLIGPVQAATPKARKFDFRKDQQFGQSLARMKRASFHSNQHEDTPARLLGGSWFLTKDSFGPGIYHVRFMVDESDEDFAYHSNAFVFYFQPADDLDTSKNLTSGQGEYLAMRWNKTGEVKMIHRPRPNPDKSKKSKKTKNKKKTLGYWMKPGPSPESKVKAGQLMDLTMRVGRPGQWLDVYLGQANTEGKPDCRFRMPDKPSSGRFGFANYKWYSRVYIQQLDYRPLTSPEGRSED